MENECILGVCERMNGSDIGNVCHTYNRACLANSENCSGTDRIEWCITNAFVVQQNTSEQNYKETKYRMKENELNHIVMLWLWTQPITSAVIHIHTCNTHTNYKLSSNTQKFAYGSSTIASFQYAHVRLCKTHCNKVAYEIDYPCRRKEW